MASNIHHQRAAAVNGGRAIDRHNPIIQDPKRLTRTLLKPPPASTSPRQYNHNNNKTWKIHKIDSDHKRETVVLADESNDEQLSTKRNNHVKRRQGGLLIGCGCTKPGNFISPANSSRFFLTDKALSDQFDPLLAQVSPPAPEQPAPPAEKTFKSMDDQSCKKKDDDSLSSSPVKTLSRSSSSLSAPSSYLQVVVLRVSLHCRGCERKMRKHISKMEGVSSFTIDFMAKKVTVVGDITPLAVLMSVSKVKNAKLLTPTTISSLPEP